MAIAVPGGDHHARPKRPRPAVCSSAMTSVASGAPSAPSCFATSLVEATAGRYSIRRTNSMPANARAIVSLEKGFIVAIIHKMPLAERGLDTSAVWV